MKDKDKAREIVKANPFLLTDPATGRIIRELLSGGG